MEEVLPMTETSEGQHQSNKQTSFSWRHGRLPCLDGWRAVAILIVLGAHCDNSIGFPPSYGRLFTWLFYGRLGVRFFFVLSGFLITLLMLREREKTGRFSLGQFWIRRSLRILPVYYAHLIALCLLQMFTVFRMDAHQWVRALTFTYNFSGPWLPGHLWSLSVEEQFYLVWPLVFLLIGPRTRLLAVFCFGVIISAAGFRVAASLGVESSAVGWNSLLTNSDSLAVGCIFGIAIFVFGDTDFLGRSCLNGILLTLGVTMILVPYIFWRIQIGGWLNVPFGAIAQSAGFALVMILSIQYHRHWSTAWLQWWWIRKLGVLSYSIYIWQQMFCSKQSMFGEEFVCLQTFPVWIAVAIICGVLSYQFIESPFLKMKTRFVVDSSRPCHESLGRQ